MLCGLLQKFLLTNPFRYCGEYYDTETGTYYLRARYYNPKIGRFLARDTYKGENNDPLSLNLYTYCKNNPIIYVDYSGFMPVDILRVLSNWYNTGSLNEASLATLVLLLNGANVYMSQEI